MQDGGANSANGDNSSGVQTVTRNSAFQNAIQVIDFNVGNNISVDLPVHLENLRPAISAKIAELLHIHVNVKCWVVQEVDDSPVLDPDAVRRVYLRSNAAVFMNRFQIDNQLTTFFEQIVNRNSNYIRWKSESVLRQLHVTSLSVSRFQPLAGACLKDLPSFLRNKKAIVNVRNSDFRCFGFSVLSALLDIKTHPERITHYLNKFQQYALDQIIYPVVPSEIPAIEQQLNIGINIFSFFDDEGKGRYPLYITQFHDPPVTIDLLYW